MGEVVEVGPGVTKLARRRPRRRAVPDRLRQLLLLRARAVLAVRELQPERAARRKDVGSFAGRHLRLLAHARRLRRRSGRVRARAVRRRRPAQGAADPERRAGAVPVRHSADRLHGRGELRHPSGRHDRSVGLRAGRPVRDRERHAARRGPRDRHRSLPRAAAHGGIDAAPRRSTTNRSMSRTRCGS